MRPTALALVLAPIAAAGCVSVTATHHAAHSPAPPYGRVEVAFPEPLRTHMLDALTIVLALAGLANDLSYEVVITSGNDRTHMEGSKHYKNQAVDIRSKDIKDKDKVITEIKARLGGRYTAFVEDLGKPNEHIHIQVK